MADNIITIPIFSTTVISGSTLPALTTTGSYDLRVSPFSSTGIVGTHLGGGIWVFTGLSDTAAYKLYNTAAGTEVTGLTGGGTNTRAFYDTALSGYVTTSGNQSGIAGLKNWTGSHDFDAQIYFDTYIPLVRTETPPLPTPTDDGHLATKKYVDDEIASLVLSSFQESGQRVRIIRSGTQETGKVYTTILAGANYFASPAAGNQCLVDVIDSGSYITMANGSLRNYVNFRGTGHHIGVHMAFNTATAICKLENMKIYLGLQGSTYGARTFASLEFYNCEIHHYAGLTLNGCPRLVNCTFLGSSTNAVTITGATNIINCNFNNAITDTGTGVRIYNDGFTLAPDADPTPPS